MTEPMPKPGDEEGSHQDAAPANPRRRITAPLTQEQLRELSKDNPWASDEEFEEFLADVAESRRRG